MDRATQETVEFGPGMEHRIFLGNKLFEPADRIVNRVFEQVMEEGSFETDEEEDERWQGLPTVPAVTGVLLHQQNRRR